MADLSAPEDFLLIDEAASYVRCSTKHLRRLVASGRLPERRIGSRLLFIREELNAIVLPAHAKGASRSPSSTSPYSGPSAHRADELEQMARGLAGIGH